MKRQKVASHAHIRTHPEPPDEARFALYGVAASFDLLPISSADTLGTAGIGL